MLDQLSTRQKQMTIAFVLGVLTVIIFVAMNR